MVRLSVITVLVLAVALALPGCGGNTSWYFCSGGPEFCSVNRDPEEPDPDDPDQAQTIGTTALLVARSMPVGIQEGLDQDGLTTVANTSPDLLAGWLLAGSLGLLLDDSDSAAATRFLDANRYWLINPPDLPRDNKLLDVGLDLLGRTTLTRDAIVSQAAAELVSGDAGRVNDDTTTAVSVAADELLKSAAEGVADGDCCDTVLLNAAATRLCADLAAADAADPGLSACPVVRQWFANYLAQQN